MAEPSRYGPRVLGQKEFQRQQEIKKKSASVYGPRVRGDLESDNDSGPAEPEQEPKQPEPDAGGSAGAETTEDGPPPPPADGEIEGMSVAQVKSALEGNPNLVDAFFEAELEREPPRVTALRAMLAAENARQGGPRDQVLEAIEFAVERAEANGDADAEGDG